MKTESRYIIAHLIEGETKELHHKITEYINKTLGLRIVNSPPHITLKDSFYCTDTDEIQEVIQNTIDTSDGTEASLILKGFGNFREEIYHIDAKLNPTAFAIHKKLIQSLREIKWLQWDQFDTIDRDFHLTLSKHVTKDKQRELTEYLDKFTPNYIIPFNNLVILKKNEEDNSWCVHKKFKVD